MNFNVADCDAIGFDMDHTLCRYNVPVLGKLMSEQMVEILIEKYKYPSDFQDLIRSFDDVVCAGGLISDVTTGSFLKVDVDGVIEKMFQNKRFLSREEIETHYKDSMWPHHDKFKKGELRQNGVYWFMEDNFSAGIMSTLAAILSHEADCYTEKTGKVPGHELYLKAFVIFNDLVGLLWDPQRFGEGNSPYFEHMKANIRDVMHPVTQDVKDWLVDMRKSGKFVFLMTSSQCDYTELVMTSCFDAEWRKYFDLSISLARKPKFYTENKEFTPVDTSRSPVAMATEGSTNDIALNGWYVEGNGESLNRFIAKVTGKTHPKVAYFGDSIKSDIFFPKLLYGWETVYIMDTLRSHQDAVHQLNSQEKQIMYSTKWGPLLHSELTMKPTLYSHLVIDKSSVAVSSVDMVAKSGDLVKFQRGGFPKLEGFHPSVLSNGLLVAKEFLKIVKKL